MISDDGEGDNFDKDASYLIEHKKEIPGSRTAAAQVRVFLISVDMPAKPLTY